MYRVDGTRIQMTRGDTFLATISITQGDEPYTPAAGDVITFALKHVKKNAAGTELRYLTV